MPALLIKGKHTDQGLVAVQRGPLVLAFDERLNPGLSATSVTPVVESDGTLKLTPATDPQGLAAHVFLGQGLTSNAVNEKAAPRTVPLVWTSFAEAGQTGSSYAVWLPSADRLKNTGGK